MNKKQPKSKRAAAASKEPFQWSTKWVDINKVKPTPKNYKIKTALGQERLKESLKQFGIAGTVVVNTDLTLIDGNSRLQEEKDKGKKKIQVSYPNKKLSPKQFLEMSAMFDFAKAGEVDIERITGDLGTSRDFLERYNMKVPTRLLDNIGAKKVKEYQAEKQVKKDKQAAKVTEDQNLNDIVMIQLFFTNEQAEDFRKWEDKLKVKFKTKSTTDTVYEAFKKLK
jgi:hypothetical protein